MEPNHPPCFNNTAKGHGERFKGNLTGPQNHHYAAPANGYPAMRLEKPPTMKEFLPNGVKVHGGVRGNREDGYRITWH
ncbi:unnamed protein product [Adineta steineri]|uniref:Uncharacterized protein n=1 Tax=Adineta steineri TaxID=433720 RepID=A0A819DWY7_9BILA|nr:unnamed protein product [Adineta steineri]CAF1399748.1 unnamed protein product [Adineta steineri]CAF3760997.1 unnamed protein product [Adineta steineri]CAF3840596.1 unnamed protein product [Adineta steineri]